MIYFGEVRDEFDRLEIRPMIQVDDTDCEESMIPELADFWSVYTVMKDNTLDCIADLETKEQAESLVVLLNSIKKL